ncbi:MAG: hypothetical protein U0W24_05985 [Bacteroidales bacterium]
MKNNLIAVLILVSAFLFSCGNNSEKKAMKFSLPEKKEMNARKSFNPKLNGFKCDSLNIKSLASANKIKEIYILLGQKLLDTLKLPTQQIPSGAEKDVMVTDFNFDGFCEFVIPDKMSSRQGGMDYYYFIFDTLSGHFMEIRSLPKFIGGFKLDIKNQRVKIYCPNESCFAYYKFENYSFKLVQGEFKSKP